MSAEPLPKPVRVVTVSRRRPHGNGLDPDPYDGVEVFVSLDYLKSSPLGLARLTDDEALHLAQRLLQSVIARSAR